MNYTTINVEKQDRDIAKRQKRSDETWGDFLRRGAEAIKAAND